MSIANFVNICANNKDVPASCFKADQLGANDLSDLLDDDPTPLTMEKMNKITEKIRRSLDDRKLASTPKPTTSTTAKLACFETKNAASKTTSAPRSARDFRRGNGPLRGGFRGGGDRRGSQDPNTIQCNVCAQLGHGWLTCPKGNKEIQKKELSHSEERDTAKEARNASLAFRRAEREEEVSEDEGYGVESEAGASVNRETYSVGSLSLSSLSLSTPSHL